MEKVDNEISLRGLTYIYFILSCTRDENFSYFDSAIKICHGLFSSEMKRLCWRYFTIVHLEIFVIAFTSVAPILANKHIRISDTMIVL